MRSDAFSSCLMRALRIFALVMTALALIPSGAHLFELPGKIGLASDDYFTVQGIYRGWAYFGIPIMLALAANFLLSLRLRRSDRFASRWAMVSAWFIAATLVHFFLRIFPTNRVTSNWTVIPADWEALRTAWEFAHAINAVVLFLAFVATAMAAVKR